MTFKDGVYNTLKWTCLIALPAISVLYVALSGIWNLPYQLEVTATIDAISVFIGTMIGISTKNYNEKK